MKKNFSCLCILCGYIWFVTASISPPLPSQKKPIIFYAHPYQDDLKKMLLRAINQARKSITIQMYGLSDEDIIHALEKKSREGLEVSVFYDPKATFSLPASIPTYPICTSGLMHRKILCIDGMTTFMGTANFTTQSLKMHENLILGIYHPQLTEHFQTSMFGYQAFPIEDSLVHCYLLPETTEEALQSLCKKIAEAEQSIQIAMFTLTHPRLLEHLVAASKRGVLIEIAIDKYARLGSSKQTIDTLKKEGINIFLHQGNSLFHHKWAWIDQKIFCLGSANWTKAAFGKNQDFLLIFENLGKQESKKIRHLWQKIAKRTVKE